MRRVLFLFFVFLLGHGAKTHVARRWTVWYGERHGEWYGEWHGDWYGEWYG